MRSRLGFLDTLILKENVNFIPLQYEMFLRVPFITCMSLHECTKGINLKFFLPCIQMLNKIVIHSCVYVWRTFKKYATFVLVW